MFWKANFPELLRVDSDDFGGVEAWWTGRMDPNSTLHQFSSPPSDNSARNQRFGKKNSWSLRIFGDCTYILFVSLPNFHISSCHRWEAFIEENFFFFQPRVILASLVLYICFLSLSSMQVSWQWPGFWCCCVGGLKRTKLFQRFQCFSLCKACRGGRGLAGTKAG